MIRTYEVPSAECVFALIDAPIGRGKHRRKELLYQFEAFVPQPVDELHTVFSNEFEGKVLACGCGRSRVHSLSLQAEIAVPESFPEWIDVHVPEKIRSSVNLLTGQFQPSSVKSYERTTAMVVCFTSLVILVSICTAVFRYRGEIGLQQALIDQQTAQLLESVLPPSVGPNTQPDTIRFATLMNTVRSTRTGVSEGDTDDLIADLAKLLEGWPAAINMQMQRLDLAGEDMSIELSIQQGDAVADVIAKFAELSDWAILSRTTTPRSDGVGLSIRFQRRPVQESSS